MALNHKKRTPRPRPGSGLWEREDTANYGFKSNPDLIKAHKASRSRRRNKLRLKLNARLKKERALL